LFDPEGTLDRDRWTSEQRLRTAFFISTKNVNINPRTI
jgi:hypothetical protein